MLYLKYRPQAFVQVVGQEHVVTTLKGALTSGRIGHAYLFTGPRGTGKTTLARLLAKSVNCESRSRNGEPDNKCQNCLEINNNRSLDLIEIDAASNRGIDEIRNLKESALVAASASKYKIFIIDEVHMLTQPAFNALLKVLEEPPSHVIFILATTEPHKIIPTVLSRVQRFDFKRLNTKQIFNKLKHISSLEKINIADEGLMSIAMSADGALRDAEVGLSKIHSAYGSSVKILENQANELLGLIPYKYHSEFLGYLVSGEREKAIDFINQINSAGINIENFTSGFVIYLRKILMHQINPAVLASFGEELLDIDIKLISAYSGTLTQDKIIRMMNFFIAAKEGMKTSPIPQLPIELAILELTQ